MGLQDMYILFLNHSLNISRGLDMTDKTWGGAREGAGRKPVEDKRVQMIITIAAETRDKLKAISKARKMKVGRIIDEMVKGEW